MYTRLFAFKENTDPPKLSFTFSQNRNHVPSYGMFARISSTYPGVILSARHSHFTRETAILRIVLRLQFASGANVFCLDHPTIVFTHAAVSIHQEFADSAADSLWLFSELTESAPVIVLIKLSYHSLLT